MRKKRDRGDKGVEECGRLRIGDHWNAISIIALSQSNPLKAVAEFVENSIDANAKNVNFPGQKAEVLLERMVELSLYTEEHLR